MNPIKLITMTDIKRNLRQRMVLVVLVTVTLIVIFAMGFVFAYLFIEPELRSETPNVSALEEYLGLILYASSLVGLGITLNSFLAQTLIKEKEQGSLESLLATPVKNEYIWIGKSLATFLPGCIFSMVMTSVALIGINLIYFLPEIGFLITPGIMVSSFFAVPLIYLALGFLVHLVGYTSKPALGNIIAQIFLPVVTSLMINLTIHDILEITSWLFAGINIAIAFVIGLVVLIVRSRFKPERVVLSGVE